MSTNKKKTSKKLITIITLILGIFVIGNVCFFSEISSMSKKATFRTEVDSNDKNSINILAMGVDIGTPGKKNDPKRTDTIMLIHYNKIDKSMTVASIPRDTLIYINGKRKKINAAHAIGGVPYTVDAVEKLLNVYIDYYGKIDYEGFRAIIDSIGGVDMDIDNNMDYDDEAQNLHIHFKKGESVHLDGKKAEEFFRWRKNNNGTGFASGDLGRIDNQHLFISKIVDKLKSPAIIFRMPSLMLTIPKYCETNMSPMDIAKYGFEFINVDNFNTKTLNGETKYIKGASYFVYNENKNNELLKVLHDEKSNIDKNTNKSKVKVQILNGTKVNGLAGEYKTYLQSKGYTNIATGNGSYTEKTEVILSKRLNKHEIRCIKEDFRLKRVKEYYKNNEKFDIIVTLGQNYEHKK